MSGLQAIDVGLGLMFIYLILGLVCTAAYEAIEGWKQGRAQFLLQGLDDLLKDKKKEFKSHPLIKSLYGDQFKTSYIPPKFFTWVLLDLFAKPDSGKPQDIQNIKDKIETSLDNSDLKKTLHVLIREAGDDLNEAKTNIGSWYNEAMTAVSGRYKIQSQKFILLISLAITFSINADTIQMAKAFSQDPQLLAAVVTQAKKITEPGQMEQGNPSPDIKKDVQTQGVPNSSGKVKDPDLEKIKELLMAVEKSGLRLGWEESPNGATEWASKFFGLLITALAVSLGAPFWFDMLKKVVNVRAGSMSPDDMEKQRKKSP